MKFPERAARAIAYLFRSYNDIDVYVEDSVSRNMYEILLERMLEGRARVTRVIQLGGRDRVISECGKDQALGGRPRLYIVDGDLDLLLGLPVAPLKRLYRLNAYCAENLVFSRAAVIEIAFESLSNESRIGIAARLDLEGLWQTWAADLLPLFALYAAARQLAPEVSTVSMSVMQLCTHQKNVPMLDPAKVAARISAIDAIVRPKTTASSLDDLRRGIELRMGGGERALQLFVSGKTYLLPLLLHYLKVHASFSGTIEQLKTRLARHTEVDIDSDFVKAVREASRAA